MADTHVNTFIQELEDAEKKVLAAFDEYRIKINALRQKYEAEIEAVAPVVAQTIRKVSTDVKDDVEQGVEDGKAAAKEAADKNSDKETASTSKPA